jgi:hypothetical protein
MEKHRPELEFMTGTSEILRLLIHSKEYGNVVGISSPVLGAGIFMTAVDKVILDYETIIQLKPCDVNGTLLETNKLKLTDITTACAFHSRYEKLFHKAPEHSAYADMYV